MYFMGEDERKYKEDYCNMYQKIAFITNSALSFILNTDKYETFVLAGSIKAKLEDIHSVINTTKIMNRFRYNCPTFCELIDDCFPKPYVIENLYGGYISKVEDANLKVLRETFTAPILNRFKNYISFKSLKEEDAKNIVNNLLNKLVKKFENKSFDSITPKIMINNKEKIIDYFVKRSNYKVDGVRNLKNIIDNEMANGILEKIAEGNKYITIDINEDNITVVGKKRNYTKR